MLPNQINDLQPSHILHISILASGEDYVNPIDPSLIRQPD